MASLFGVIRLPYFCCWWGYDVHPSRTQWLLCN